MFFHLLPHLHSTPPHAHCPVFVYLIGRKANTNSNRKAFFERMYVYAKNWNSSDRFSNIYLHGLAFFIKVRILCPFTVSAQKNDYYGVCKHRNREKHFDYHKGDLLAINYGFCDILFRLMKLGVGWFLYHLRKYFDKKVLYKVMRNHHIYSNIFLMIERTWANQFSW